MERMDYSIWNFTWILGFLINCKIQVSSKPFISLLTRLHGNPAPILILSSFTKSVVSSDRVSNWFFSPPHYPAFIAPRLTVIGALSGSGQRPGCAFSSHQKISNNLTEYISRNIIKLQKRSWLPHTCCQFVSTVTAGMSTQEHSIYLKIVALHGPWKDSATCKNWP